MAETIRVVGLGGSLRTHSTSRTALEVALAGADADGADTELASVRDLDLPLYSPELPVPDDARRLAGTIAAADAMIWSSPTYQGSVSGSFKNVLDWLVLLGEIDPPYLSNMPVGLIATAGGVQGLQAVNTMDFIVRAMRGWAVPLVLAIGGTTRTFDSDGRLTDDAAAAQLRALGAEVVRAATQFHDDGVCDYADGQQFPGSVPS
jgi:FMN reductase